MRLTRMGLAASAALVAVLFSLALSALIMGLSGSSPATGFTAMLHRITEWRYILQTINDAVPYYLAALAVAIGFKMNLFNIGVEGQYRLAALVAAFVGGTVPLPGPLRLILMFVVAMAVGALWAGIAGFLKASRGVSEVISTIMLNAVALGLMGWLLYTFFRSDSKGSLTVGTAPLPESAMFPNFTSLLEALDLKPRGTTLYGFIVVAAVVGILYGIMVWRTRFGFDLRASGVSEQAAAASGVNAKRMVVWSMVISGAIAGLVGMAPLVTAAGRYTDDAIPVGLGFTGIAVALLGRNHPVGIAIGALLWAYLDQAANALALVSIPKQIVIIIQGVIVLSVVVAYEIAHRIGDRIETKRVAMATHEDPPITPGGAPQGGAPQGGEGTGEPTDHDSAQSGSERPGPTTTTMAVTA